MIKKYSFILLVGILVLAMSFSLIACGNNDGGEDIDPPGGNQNEENGDDEQNPPAKTDADRILEILDGCDTQFLPVGEPNASAASLQNEQGDNGIIDDIERLTVSTADFNNEAAKGIDSFKKWINSEAEKITLSEESSSDPYLQVWGFKHFYAVYSQTIRYILEEKGDAALNVKYATNVSWLPSDNGSFPAFGQLPSSITIMGIYENSAVILMEVPNVVSDVKMNTFVRLRYESESDCEIEMIQRSDNQALSEWTVYYNCTSTTFLYITDTFYSYNIGGMDFSYRMAEYLYLDLNTLKEYTITAAKDAEVECTVDGGLTENKAIFFVKLTLNYLCGFYLPDDVMVGVKLEDDEDMLENISVFSDFPETTHSSETFTIKLVQPV